MANPNTNLISADALDITKFTAWGGAIAGILSGVVAVIAKLQTSWPTPILVALIGFSAVAMIVVGAVVITDQMVRRDLAKKVMPTVGNDPAVPLVYQIWKELRPDVEKAAPAVEEILKTALAGRAETETLEDAVWKKFESVRDADGHHTKIRETVELEAS